MKNLFIISMLFIVVVVFFSENALARTGLKTILGGQYTSKWVLPKGFKVKRTVLVQGRKTEGGCEIGEHLNDKAPINAIEIEYDPETCRSLVVVGWTKETQAILKKRNIIKRIHHELQSQSH